MIQTEDELADRLEGFRATILTEDNGRLYQFSDDIPSPLYYYTSPQVTKKMIQKDVVQATNIGFMNDSSELVYAFDLAREILSEKLGGETPFPQGYIGKIMEDFWGDPPETMEFYAFCVSERGDHLPQWREYANDGKGYAFGFDFQNFKLEPRYAAEMSTLLVDVEYNKETHKTEIGTLIEDWLSIINELKDELIQDEEVIEALLADLSSAVMLRAYQYKHPAYEPEQEWRFVFSSSHLGDEVQNQRGFRGSSSHIAPYHELVASDAEGNKKPLPIQEIVAGPRAIKRRGVHALELMRSQEEKDFEISESEVPMGIL